MKPGLLQLRRSGRIVVFTHDTETDRPDIRIPPDTLRLLGIGFEPVSYTHLVIMVPAFTHQVPVMPHTPQTRDYLVEQLRKLGDYAREQGTTCLLYTSSHRRLKSSARRMIMNIS